MKKNDMEEKEKAKPRRLTLRRETIKALDDAALEQAAGGDGRTSNSTVGTT